MLSKQYFSILLIQQNDLIFGKYKITSEQVIDGLEKYNKFLSSGLNDAVEL
jgi:hypothetical protein